MARAIFACFTILLFCAPMPAVSQDYRSLTDLSDIGAEAQRLKTAVTKIFKLGIETHLTPAEKRELGNIEFKFPMPKSDDYFLNFYAYEHEGRSVVVMPVLSLKVLEDLTTAFAWLHVNGFSYGTEDLFLAMLRHRQISDFPGKRYPALLDALGVPKKAYELPKVDTLSLSLRNEAYAFVLTHELGHIRFHHKGYDRITKAQARADEIQSDRFALDVLSRTGTPPMGAVLFFQAQAYNTLHRGEFSSDADWMDFMKKEMTHPLSTDRLQEMVTDIRGRFLQKRAAERDVWLSIANRLQFIIEILKDQALYRCVANVAKNEPLDILKPRRDIARTSLAKYCPN